MSETESIIDRMSRWEVIRFIERGGKVPKVCTHAAKHLGLAVEVLTQCSAAWHTHRPEPRTVIHERAVKQLPEVRRTVNRGPRAIRRNAA